MARWLSYLAVVGLLCMVQWSCLVNGAPLPSPASNEPLPPPQSLEWGQYLDKPIPGQVQNALTFIVEKVVRGQTNELLPWEYKRVAAFFELLPREYRVLLAMRAVDDFAFAKDFAAARVNADLSPVASKSLVFHDMTSPMSADPADLEYHWFTGAKTEDGKLPEIIPGEQQKRFPTRRFFEKGGAGLPSINQDLAGLQTGQFNQPQRPSPPLNLDVFKAAQAKSQTLPSMPESAL